MQEPRSSDCAQRASSGKNRTTGMDALIAFWIANRNEILVTVVTIILIHVITSGGGFVKRRGGAKRVEGTGFPPPASSSDPGESP